MAFAMNRVAETAELQSSAPGARVPEDCADPGLGAFTLLA